MWCVAKADAQIAPGVGAATPTVTSWARPAQSVAPICPPIVAPYRLGTLCKHGHDHAGTGMSLRLARSNCRQCNIDRAKAWAAENADRRRQVAAVGAARRLAEDPSGVRQRNAEKSRRSYARHFMANRARCRCGREKGYKRQKCKECIKARDDARRSYNRALQQSERGRLYHREKNKARLVNESPPQLRHIRELLYEANSLLLKIKKDNT